MAKSSTLISKWTPEYFRTYPWFSFAVCLAVLWFILSKLGNSATWVGDAIRKVTNPNVAEMQEHSEAAFDASHQTGNPTWTPQKIRSDAKSIATNFRTFKGSTWWDRIYFVWNDDPVYNILKNYTNASMKRILDAAYQSLYTDGRSLDADIESICTSTTKKVLHDKGIY